jgi:hypothetical protein
MNLALLNNGTRFVILLLLQVIVFSQARIGPLGSYYIDIIVFPLAYLLLPFRTPREFQFLLAFAIGLLVDLAMQSPGLHAGASVFTIAVRPIILRLLEPRGGYDKLHSPTLQRFKLPWFAPFISILSLVHILFYFSMEVFTPLFLGAILIKTLLSWIVSTLFIFLIVIILNPLD